MKESWGFPGGSMVKNPSANTGDANSIPRTEDTLEKQWNPLQYACLGNATDRGAQQGTVREVTKESTTKRILTGK